MGLFDGLARLFGYRKTRPVARAQLMSGAERTAEWWDTLKKSDPAMYQQLYGVKLRVIPMKPKDAFEDFFLMMGRMEQLKKGGFLGDSNKDSVDKLIDNLPALLTAGGQFIQTSGIRQQPQRQRIQQQANDDDEEYDEVPDSEEEPDSAETEEVANVPISPKMIAEFVKLSLKGKTPRAAAKWILEQKHPAASGMVDVIRKTTNENLFATLDAHADSEPAFRGLINWLKSQGDWTLQVAEHIRRQPTMIPTARRRVRSI